MKTIARGRDVQGPVLAGVRWMVRLLVATEWVLVGLEAATAYPTHRVQVLIWWAAAGVVLLIVGSMTRQRPEPVVARPVRPKRPPGSRPAPVVRRLGVSSLRRYGVAPKRWRNATHWMKRKDAGKQLKRPRHPKQRHKQVWDRELGAT